MTRGIFLDPVERAFGSPVQAWVLAGAVGAYNTLVDDVFFWLFWILCAANALDWFAGRHAARKRGSFSIARAREGLYSKALGLGVVLILRSVEAVVPLVTRGFETHGGLAATITLLLILEDLRSVDGHRQFLGKPPIPLLSAAVSSIHTATGGDRRRQEQDGSHDSRRSTKGEAP